VLEISLYIPAGAIKSVNSLKWIDCAPLSYRSVDENNYKEAILVFYELGNIFELKKIFIEQYLFSAANYNIKTQA